MPSEEVANPTELGRFRHIKDRLQDPAFDVWVHAKNDWLKVLSTSLINHISPMGVSFQAPTNPQYPFHFGIFHICRETPCEFKGTSLGQGAPFYHVTSISIRESHNGDTSSDANDRRAPVVSKPDTSAPAPNALPAKQSPIKASVAKKALRPNSTPRSIVFGYRLFYLSALVTFIGLVSKTATLVKELDLGVLLEHKLEDGIASFVT